MLNKEGINARFIKGKMEIENESSFGGFFIDGFVVEFSEIEEMKDEIMRRLT